MSSLGVGVHQRGRVPKRILMVPTRLSCGVLDRLGVVQRKSHAASPRLPWHRVPGRVPDGGTCGVGSSLHQAKDVKEPEMVKPRAPALLPLQHPTKESPTNRRAPRDTTREQETRTDVTTVFGERKAIAPSCCEYVLVTSQHDVGQCLVGVPRVARVKRPSLCTRIPPFLVEKAVNEASEYSPIRIEYRDHSSHSEHSVRLGEEALDVRNVVPSVLEYESIQ